MSEQDKDAPMAAADTPSGLAETSTPPPKPKETAELQEKYRKLKRRFFELEEKHKETSTELQRSGERNVKMREERNILLDRIIELEAQPGVVAGVGGPTSPTDGTSGAFPRSLLDSRARTSFTQNLRDAAAEDEADADADADIDPALVTQHVNSPPPAPNDAPAAQTRGKIADAADNAETVPADTPVLVSSTGTRLRIRPVGDDPSADPAISPASSSHPPSADPQPRSVSPDSSGMPVDDENDQSGDYSPPTKGTKRARDSTDYNGDLVAVAPEPKVPRRSSRRSGGATAAQTSAPRTRVIQAATTKTRGKAAVAAASSPGPTAEDDAQQGSSEKRAEPSAPETTSTNSNGHNTQNDPAAASSSSAASPAGARQGHLAFNPYLPYLAPGAPMSPASPYPYGNPYAYYMPAPMPGGPMPPYMPPPNYAPPPQQRPPAEAPRAAKPKRLKAHTVTSKSYSIPMVPRDKKGKPMLPLNVGIMTVISLGDVCMREHFHTERYIFPVGYEVTRRYLSTVDQNAEVVYHCTILDGGDGPKFQIIPSDVPDRPVIAGTATGAWSTIVKQANAIRQRQHSNSVSGPDFFGLGQNTIKHLIQELPNADRLRDYVWQHFVEGGPLGGRHAAVIPALPEEYDKAMPVGPYYPPRPRIPVREREEGEGSTRGSYYPPHIVAQAAAKQQQRPPPQQQQQQQGPPPPQEYDGGGGVGGRQVMPPPPGGGSYYLPHTQQQSSGEASAAAAYPGPPPGVPNGNGGSSFASIMNAFPTQGQDSANGGPEGGS
ncbi:F/Y rich C-terminus-domain-containing protein [Mycena galericulata]|nr:F/Y rich C-terminus-domain-containing protein [Mycena galericulata]